MLKQKNIPLIFLSSCIIIILAVCLQLFLLPEFDVSETGPLGDTVGGLTSPIINLLSAVLVYFAFRAQIKANRQVQKQFKSQQFESQFYEMLKLHKDNVSEMTIEGYDLDIETVVNFNNLDLPVSRQTISKKETKLTNGKKVFVTMVTELEACFQIILDLKKEDKKNLTDTELHSAYYIFFMGLESYNSRKKKNERIIPDFFNARRLHIESFSKNNKYNNAKLYFKYKPFSGHVSRLSHYYRHLFQLVKFVANQREDFITYERKRNYLRILRAQLTNHEQMLLYYNWVSGFAPSWEDDTNQFFTDFRMIHNILPDELFDDKKFNLEKLREKEYRKEQTRVEDSLFEQDPL